MFHPVFAFLSPEIIGIVAIGAVLLFGADKLPKLARSFGAAKKEFTMGQIEADEAAAKARVESQARIEAGKAEPATSDEQHTPTA